MAKKWTIVFGIVFIVIGLLGFIQNSIVGVDAIFVTDAAHNIVHILSGIVFLIVAAKSERSSSMVLIVFGIVYLLVTILGFISEDTVLGLIKINQADNYLHLVLSLAFLAVGFGTRSKMPTQA